MGEGGIYEKTTEVSFRCNAVDDVASAGGCVAREKTARGVSGVSSPDALRSARWILMGGVCSNGRRLNGLAASFCSACLQLTKEGREGTIQYLCLSMLGLGRHSPDCCGLDIGMDPV